MLKLIFFCVALLIAFGCSMTPKSMQCNKWRDDGLLFSTTESCVRCIEAVGRNVDAVRGCALGMDAATLIIPDRR